MKAIVYNCTYINAEYSATSLSFIIQCCAYGASIKLNEEYTSLRGDGGRGGEDTLRAQIKKTWVTRPVLLSLPLSLLLIK